MLNLLTNDLKRSIDIKRTILAALIAWTALFFFVQFFSEDMTEDRLLERLSIGIVDHEKSQLSRMLIQSFQSNDKFTSLVSISEGSLDALSLQYEEGQLTAIVIIPDDFTTSLLHYENKPLDVILNPNHPLKSTVLNEMLSSYSDYIKSVDAATYGLYRTLKEGNMPQEKLMQTNDLFSIEMISTALGRNRLFEYETVATFPATTSSVYFGSAILVMVAAFSATGILPLVFDDLRQNCLQRYMALNSHLYKWVLSKLIALGLNVTFLCTMIAIPIMVIFKFTLLQGLVLTLQIMIISIFYGALALLLGVFTGNESSATVTANLLTFALGLVGGNFIPLPLMPKSIQDISSFTPNYWAIRGLLGNIADISTGLGIIEGLFIVITCTIAFICAKKLEVVLHKGGVIYE